MNCGYQARPIAVKQQSHPYLGCSEGFCIFPATGSREEDNVVNGLNQLQLYDTFDEHAGEHCVNSHFCNTRSVNGQWLLWPVKVLQYFQLYVCM